MFFDETKVFLKAGNGGMVVLFLRQHAQGGLTEVMVVRGDLPLQADENVFDLRAFISRNTGRPKWRTGRVAIKTERGDPCGLKVLGTEVRSRL